MEILYCIIAPLRNRSTTGKIKPGIALVEGPFRFACNSDRFSKERLRLPIALLVGKGETKPLNRGQEFRSGDLTFHGEYLPIEGLRFRKFMFVVQGER